LPEQLYRLTSLAFLKLQLFFMHSQKAPGSGPLFVLIHESDIFSFHQTRRRRAWIETGLSSGQKLCETLADECQAVNLLTTKHHRQNITGCMVAVFINLSGPYISDLFVLLYRNQKSWVSHQTWDQWMGELASPSWATTWMLVPPSPS